MQPRWGKRNQFKSIKNELNGSIDLHRFFPIHYPFCSAIRYSMIPADVSLILPFAIVVRFCGPLHMPELCFEGYTMHNLHWINITHIPNVNWLVQI